MKSIRIILLSVLVLTMTGIYAQTNNSEEVKIKVNFHCANGKALLEKELVKEPGVTSAIADLETKVVTITYESGKQNKEKLVAAIEKIGYTTEFTKEGTEIKKACSHDMPKSE
ncbi:MAG: Heavy-metal-associated domain protein [Bacteroidetes bacterium ADurb.Bin408]|nr:MAG: Heavy-metal-associated domain protein [Bacteroidetes bacterium ADurb.Bin408]